MSHRDSHRGRGGLGGPTGGWGWTQAGATQSPGAAEIAGGSPARPSPAVSSRCASSVPEMTGSRQKQGRRELLVTSPEVLLVGRRGPEDRSHPGALRGGSGQRRPEEEPGWSRCQQLPVHSGPDEDSRAGQGPPGGTATWAPVRPEGKCSQREWHW